jgi:hypothetical protein
MRVMEFPRRKPFPFDSFWAVAAPVGFYGASPGERVLLSGNHTGELSKLAQVYHPGSGCVLALDSHGLLLSSAASMKLVGRAEIESALMTISPANPGGKLIIQSGVLALMNLKRGDQIAGWEVFAAPEDREELSKWLDQSNDTGEAPAGVARLVNPWLRRITGGLGLALGQWMLMAIPMAIFGWQALVVGTVALFVNAMLISAAWPYLPGPGYLRGGLVGGILAALCAIVWFTSDMLQNPFIFFGLLAAGAWIGAIFSGTKPPPAGLAQEVL